MARPLGILKPRAADGQKQKKPKKGEKAGEKAKNGGRFRDERNGFRKGPGASAKADFASTLRHICGMLAGRVGVAKSPFL